MNYQVSLGKKRADTCYYKEYNKGDCIVSGTIRLHFYCKYCIKVRRLKKNYKKGASMNSETLFKEAYKCFNSKNGDCPISYNDPNLFDRCFFCLEHIQGIKPPKNIKESDPPKNIKSKKKGSEIILKKSPGKELEIPKYEIQKFKFPIDLIEFSPLKKTKDFKIITEKDKSTLELFLSGYYGKYLVKTFRKFKIMDYRTLLAVLYFTDYYKNKAFKNKVIEWLDLLEVEDTGFYRKSIAMGMDFLVDLKFYTPYIYDSQLKQRNSSFNLTEKGEIDFSNLPSFSVFHLIDSYHHIKQKDKRKSKIKVNLSDIFYKRVFLDKYYTLINFKKILPLRDIALNLYLLIKRQDPKDISDYTIDFERVKAHIGITDKHITNARKTFEKAWNDIKGRGLLKGYQYRIFISKKDSKEKIKFSRQRDLTS
ncbi:hypothetical protein ES703_23267 [subsurface metagenome]